MIVCAVPSDTTSSVRCCRTGAVIGLQRHIFPQDGGRLGQPKEDGHNDEGCDGTNKYERLGTDTPLLAGPSQSPVAPPLPVSCGRAALSSILLLLRRLPVGDHNGMMQ